MSNASEDSRPRLARTVTDDDHSQGPARAPLTLVEYGDYECPYCGTAYGVVKELQSEFGNQLRIVFRNFPLTDAHPHALSAALAAEAAGAQGRFWEMHDLLYEHQRALTSTDLQRYAQQLGLAPQSVTAPAANVFESRVEADYSDGIRSGVEGTPTFFINGIRHDGGLDVAGLRDALEADLR